MSKTKSLLTKLFNAAFAWGRADMKAGDLKTTTIEAIRALKGGNQDEVQRTFVLARLASLFSSSDTVTDQALAKATSIVDGCSPKATPKAGQSARSEEEQKLFRAAMQLFNDTLAKNGLSTTKKQGGHNKGQPSKRKIKGKGKGKGKAVTVRVERTVEDAPASPTAAEAKRFLIKEAAFLDAYLAKNSAILGTALMQSIIAFRDTITALCKAD